MAKPDVEELVKKRDVAGLIEALRYKPKGKFTFEAGGIRRKAARALGGLGDQRAIRPLCRRLGDIDIPVRGAALKAILAILNQLTEKDRRKIVRRLIDEFGTTLDREEEKGLVEVLAMIGEPAAEGLLRYTEYPSQRTRENAALALGKMGDTRAVKLLMRIVNDQSSLNTNSAAALLGQIGDTQAVKTLGRAMRSATADLFTCRSIAEALGKMGTSGLEELTQTIHSRHEYAPLCAAEVLQDVTYKVEPLQRMPMTDRDRRKFEKLEDELQARHEEQLRKLESGY